jgi:hypothetical protein
MPFVEKAVKSATDRLPKVINPAAHAIIDYGMAASFFGMAAAHWKANKKAATSNIICGAAELATALLTDYPGGVFKRISFPTHGRIDIGMATLIASLPGMMGFKDEPEARFFSMQAISMAAVTGLTDFTGSGRSGQLRRIEGRAA